MAFASLAGNRFGYRGSRTEKLERSIEGGCVMAHEYKIIRGDVVLCRSSLPCCGYQPKKVRQMIADGHRYLVDGKERKV